MTNVPPPPSTDRSERFGDWTQEEVTVRFGPPRTDVTIPPLPPPATPRKRRRT